MIMFRRCVQRRSWPERVVNCLGVWSVLVKISWTRKRRQLERARAVSWERRILLPITSFDVSSSFLLLFSFIFAPPPPSSSSSSSRASSSCFSDISSSSSSFFSSSSPSSPSTTFASPFDYNHFFFSFFCYFFVLFSNLCFSFSLCFFYSSTSLKLLLLFLFLHPFLLPIVGKVYFPPSLLQACLTLSGQATQSQSQIINLNQTKLFVNESICPQLSVC